MTELNSEKCSEVDLKYEAQTPPEPSQRLVIVRQAALPLQDDDVHAGLVVCCRGEGLFLGGGDRGVARDELGHDAAQSLQAQGEGGHVQEHDGLHLAGKHAPLGR
jgi:hypothetical protein